MQYDWNVWTTSQHKVHRWKSVFDSSNAFVFLQGVVDLLMDDNQKREVGLAYRQDLEDQMRRNEDISKDARYGHTRYSKCLNIPLQ